MVSLTHTQFRAKNNLTLSRAIDEYIASHLVELPWRGRTKRRKRRCRRGRLFRAGEMAVRSLSCIHLLNPCAEPHSHSCRAWSIARRKNGSKHLCSSGQWAGCRSQISSNELPRSGSRALDMSWRSTNVKSIRSSVSDLVTQVITTFFDCKFDQCTMALCDCKRSDLRARVDHTKHVA